MFDDEPSADDLSVDVVAIESYQTLIEAQAICNRLEQVGIPAQVGDVHMGTTVYAGLTITGGVKVLVRPEDAERANAFLHPPEEAAPEPEPKDRWSNRALAMGLFGIVFPFIGLLGVYCAYCAARSPGEWGENAKSTAIWGAVIGGLTGAYWVWGSAHFFGK